MTEFFMTELTLIFWVISAVLLIFTQKIYRVIIIFGVFSLISSGAYLFLGSPDVAMAEAAISAFATIFFVICVERYYVKGDHLKREETKVPFKAMRFLPPLVFMLAVLGMFLYFVPTGEISSYLRELYLTSFMYDVGGTNAVTSIYLGYRVYDTLFEALILVIAVVAVGHMSWYSEVTVDNGKSSEIKHYGAANFTLRIISPLLLIFGAYLIANGHISAGGGFQGGLAIAAFFICRYLIYDIYDIPIKKVMKMEELIFINITILPVLAVFMGLAYMLGGVIAVSQNAYLLIMNILIGLKVACGFFLLFYRYIAIEKMDEPPASMEVVS